jgi:RNA polymerase sigma-70 factor (ECF subfamily)
MIAFGKTVTTSLADNFLARLPAAARAQTGADAGLESSLSAMVASAQSAWPSVHVPPEVFVSHLANHCASGAASLADLRTDDLYLACGCALGDGAALSAFEAAYFPDIVPALARATRATGLRDEVAQELRRLLFLPRERAGPQIALYAGRGTLRNWTRAAIVRVILTLVTRGPRDVPTGGDLFEALPSTLADPELAHMKDVYQVAFRAAFSSAIASLTSRERNLLRHAFVDGLNVDQVGALFGVHRATAARWVAGARAKLMADVRRSLMQELAVDDGEFSSIMRLIRSQLHVTLARHLGSGPDER